MRRNESTKALLSFIFIGILISGFVVTIVNYRRWSGITTSIVREYKKIQALQNINKNTGDEENIQNNTSEEQNIQDSSSNTGEHAEHGQPYNNSNDESGTGEINESGSNSEKIADRRITEMGSIEGFYVSEITDSIFSYINGKSYREGCPVSVDELRYVHILHFGFDGNTHNGELIVHADIAKDVLEIFEELYAIKYPIEKVRLIEEYGTDDEKSMEDNNSSAFNFRTIAESTTLSNHAYGRAIDINPFYNPYVYDRSDGSRFLQPAGSEKYLDRTLDEGYIIKKGDPCYDIFISHGFKWGGDWNPAKDYQHFEKLN